MEPDEDKRLEMAARIDEDAAELDDRWDEREEWDAERDRLNAERDEAIAERDRYREERDESRRKYADRFFAVEGQTLLHANEVGEEVRREPIRSADEIWD
jgi:uncharacterized coiled-coil DUF342 family protein